MSHNYSLPHPVHKLPLPQGLYLTGSYKQVSIFKLINKKKLAKRERIERFHIFVTESDPLVVFAVLVCIAALVLLGLVFFRKTLLPARWIRQSRGGEPGQIVLSSSFANTANNSVNPFVLDFADEPFDSMEEIELTNLSISRRDSPATLCIQEDV